jgi:hypothetical protein
MKFNDNLFLVLAIGCFTIALGYVGYSFAANYANQQCVSMYPTGSCEQTGGAQCAAGGSTCNYCNVASAIPNRSCVAMEGQTCSLGGGAAQYCVGGTLNIAQCVDQTCVIIDTTDDDCGNTSGPYFPCD